MSTTTPVFNLVIHSGYESVTIGLYKNGHNIALQNLDKKIVSAFLMPSLIDLLKKSRLMFQDLSFIGVHSGPAPFTTLRVGITTVNGIGFATHIPLIPVNGLELLSTIYKDYVVLLNAFCDDVYIGINGKVLCQNINTFIEQQQYSDKIVTYIGNAVPLHQKRIEDALGSKAHFLTEYPHQASIDMIAKSAYTKWLDKQDITAQVLPVYLKQYSAKIAH